jgi:hypothetical protein
MYYLSKKLEAQFEITVLPSHGEILTSQTRLLWCFHNGGPGRVHVEAHTPSPGPSADLICVSAEGALLSAGDIAEFSGTGPITLSAVDDELAVVMVTVAVESK